MSFQVFEKDPNSVLDWKWDWAAWLQVSEVINTVTVVPEVGITVDSSSNTTNTVTVFLSGGTLGNYYDVTVRIVTNQGRTEDNTIRILIKEH